MKRALITCLVMLLAVTTGVYAADFPKRNITDDGRLRSTSLLKPRYAPKDRPVSVSPGPGLPKEHACRSYVPAA